MDTPPNGEPLRGAVRLDLPDGRHVVIDAPADLTPLEALLVAGSMVQVLQQLASIQRPSLTLVRGTLPPPDGAPPHFPPNH